MSKNKKSTVAQEPSWVAEVAYWKANERAVDRAFEIGMRIMDLMDAKGWSNTDLANAISKKPQYVSRLRKGQEHNIGQKLLIALERALGAPITEVADSPAEVVATQTVGKTYELHTVNAAFVLQQHFEYSTTSPPLRANALCGDELGADPNWSMKNAPFLMS